jgi:hypothetical protein
MGESGWNRQFRAPIQLGESTLIIRTLGEAQDCLRAVEPDIAPSTFHSAMRALSRACAGDPARRLMPATVATLKALYEAGTNPIMIMDFPAQPPADDIVKKPRPRARTPDIQQKLRRQIAAAKKLSAKKRSST